MIYLVEDANAPHDSNTTTLAVEGDNVRVFTRVVSRRGACTCNLATGDVTVPAGLSRERTIDSYHPSH
jgi:hypothetical protein